MPVFEMPGGEGEFYSSRFIVGAASYIESVANGNAQIAVIYCVSYQLVKDHQPELLKPVRSIGYSAQTCGLPFVIPSAIFESIDTDQIVEKLNHTLTMVPGQVGNVLHLTGFETVGYPDYQGIADLENIARDHGYPELE
jgi:ABC-type phosphate/phosphonate transport system substrate-binding protein